MSTKRISPNVDEEYLKCPDIKRDEIQKLQVWIQTQPHLPQLTEYELMVFYAGADYSIEATKQLIENNMACRTHFEEFFGCFDVDTPRIRKVFKTIAGFPLPKRTPAGYLVVMGKLLDTDPLNYNYNDYVKLPWPLPKTTLRSFELRPFETGNQSDGQTRLYNERGHVKLVIERCD